MFCLNHFLNNKINNLTISVEFQKKIEEFESYISYLNRIFNLEITLENSTLSKLKVLVRNLIEGYKLCVIVFNNETEKDDYYLNIFELLIAECISISQELNAKYLEIKDSSNFLKFCLKNEEINRKITRVDVKRNININVLTKNNLKRFELDID